MLVFCKRKFKCFIHRDSKKHSRVSFKGRSSQVYTFQGAYKCTHTLIHIHNGILPSQKKDEILPFTARLMDLEAMLYGISHTEKDKHCMISLIYGVKIIQQTSRGSNNNKNKQSHR